MTRNNDGDRIFAVGVPDRSKGIWFADYAGNFTVRDYRTEGYFFKLAPDQSLKFRALGCKVQKKSFALACKIFIELLHTLLHTKWEVMVAGPAFFREIQL